MGENIIEEKLQQMHDWQVRHQASDDSAFKTFQTTLDEDLRQTNKVLDHVEKTNGRISKLELWRMYIMGGMSVIILMIVPILLFMVYKTLGK
jgi:hypothetical protein